jgi:hypothetical protein
MFNGKLLTAIDPMTSRIYSIPGMKGGKKKRRKTKKKKKRRKKGGARTPGTQFPELGKKINEIMKKVQELNGRLHDVEHFYLPEISKNETSIEELAKREGYLRSYINFQHRSDIQEEPYVGHETPMDKWAKHIDSHHGDDRADVHDYLQGGRKRKSRRKRKRRKKTRKKKENSQNKKDKTPQKMRKKRRRSRRIYHRKR